MSDQQHPQSNGKENTMELGADLPSCEPQATEQSNQEESSPIWDSEADHMLNYFLDGNEITSPPCPHTRLPTNAVSHSANHPGEVNSVPAHQPSISDRILQHPFRTNNFPGAAFPGQPTTVSQHQVLGLNDNTCNHSQQPPPTPVIQHYFPSTSSAPKNISETSSDPVSSAISSGIPMARQTHQFSFNQQHHHHHQQQQPPPQPQPQQINPIEAMKQNFMKVYDQNFASSGETGTLNHVIFQGQNATTEEAMPSISPALDFGRDHEPLLLPENGGIATPQPLNQPPQINALAPIYSGTIQANAYGISGAATATNDNTSMHPVEFNKEQQVLVSSGAVGHMPLHFGQTVADAQKKLVHSIPSTDSVTSTNPNLIVFPQAVAGSIHPSLSASHPFFFPHHLTTAYLMKQAESAEETEEKRAKRLERNRESARKSRRRKKERLLNSEEKVNDLYSKIENERRSQINSMDSAWKAFESNDLLELKQLQEVSLKHPDDYERNERLRSGLSRLFIGEKEQAVFKEVVEFQYTSLAQHLLPRYQKFLLWTILQNQSYFLTGKEEHAKRDLSKRITMGKISSKQLGEEISNGSKHLLKKRKGKEQDQPQGNTTAHVSEPEKFWPLVCFELSMSVEQEERFLEKQDKQRQANTLQRNINQIEAATRIASRAKECVLYQIHLAAYRKKKAYQNILTPRQAILYQAWLLSNKDRVSRMVLSNRRKGSLVSTEEKRELLASQESLDWERNKDLTLAKLCQYLTESMEISKNLQD